MTRQGHCPTLRAVGPVGLERLVGLQQFIGMDHPQQVLRDLGRPDRSRRYLPHEVMLQIVLAAANLVDLPFRSPTTPTSCVLLFFLLFSHLLLDKR